MRRALRSHVGRVRQVNEDHGWTGRLEYAGLTAAIVADGMGGHKAGEVASELAVESLTRSLYRWETELSAAESEERLQEVLRKANKTVYETASLNEQYSNMGTTVVMALLSRNAGLIGHIGDSRVYLIREGAIRQLTDDHTLVNELAKSGQLTPEEAAHHPRRNVITRALGTDREVTADILRIDWLPGDQLLLCSDGLSNMVEEPDILQTMSDAGLDLEQKADRLVELALAAGGDDNVTVALIDYETDGDGAGEGTA